MGNLASRDTYGCVLLDILRFLSRPFLQRESAEASQEYASTPAECILHAFHETLDYQGNGLAVNPLFLGNPVYNISLSHIRLGQGKSSQPRSGPFLGHVPCPMLFIPFEETVIVPLAGHVFLKAAFPRCSEQVEAREFLPVCV